MKLPSNDREQKLHLVAAAVLLGLGSMSAAAQQPGSEQESESQQAGQQQQEQDRPGAFEQEQDSPGAFEQEEDELETAAADTQSPGAGAEALDQIAEEHDDLSTFVEAVRAAGMQDALTGDTDYTVFAPTNDAFEQMSGMSTEELLREENREQLVSLLRAHIVADDVDEDMARSLSEAQTIDGGTVDISAEQDQIQVGDASVVESGIESGNLRVYAIDGVLSQDTALARAEDTGQQEAQGAGAGQSESERDDPLADDPFDTESQEPGQQPGQQPGQDQPGAGSPGQAGGESDDPFGQN